MNCFFTSTMDDFFFLIVQTRVGESLARYWEGLPVCQKSLEGCGVFRGNLDNASVPLCLHGKVKDQEVDKKTIQTRYVGIFKKPPCRKKSARLAKFA